MHNDFARLRKCVDFGNGNIVFGLISGLIFLLVFSHAEVSLGLIILLTAWCVAMLLSGLGLRRQSLWAVRLGLFSSVIMVMLGVTVFLWMYHQNDAALWFLISSVPFTLYGLVEAVFLFRWMISPARIDPSQRDEMEWNTAVANLRFIGSLNTIFGVIIAFSLLIQVIQDDINLKSVVVFGVIVISALVFAVGGYGMSNRRPWGITLSLYFNTCFLALFTFFLICVLFFHKIYDLMGTSLMFLIVLIYAVVVRYVIWKHQKLMRNPEGGSDD